MIAIVPARSGSKRVKNKNLKLLKDHPLMAYTIEACLKSSLIERVVVSTNCTEIARVARHYGAEVPFMRPEKYAQDGSSDLGFLKHFFDFFKSESVEEVALMRPTSPMRDPEVINDAIRHWNTVGSRRKRPTGLRTVTFSNHSPYKLYQMDDNSFCFGFFDDYKGIKNYTNLPGQIFPKTYVPNGYIDIVRKETVMQGTVFGDKILGLETPSITDIDTEEDFYLASLQVGSKLDKLKLKKGERFV